VKPAVFISYRRSDAAGYARGIHSRLQRAFPGRVFLDVGDIPPGADFAALIERSVAKCEALVALIGARWLEGGRVHEPGDFVRIEIAAALQRGVTVIPVLVQRARIPTVEDLPEELHGLARRQSLEIFDEDWEHGCDRLVAALEGYLGPAKRRWRPWLLGGSVLATSLLGIATLLVLAPVLYFVQLARSYLKAADAMGWVADQIAGATPAGRSSSQWWVVAVALAGAGLWALRRKMKK
jgi:hypothetical protein